MKIKRRSTPGPWIPFITLADIAWQIIIFFLIGATFAHNESLNVTLPSVAPNPQQTLKPGITVEASESALAVNGVPVALSELSPYLAGLLTGVTAEEQRAVVVSPADDLSFQRNADILFAIQAAGGVVVISEEHRDENPSQED